MVSLDLRTDGATERPDLPSALALPRPMCSMVIASGESRFS